MALEPITRQEKIIAGQDLTPITRMEKFLKEFGGSGGGEMVVNITSEDGSTYTADKTFVEISEAIASQKTVSAHCYSPTGALQIMPMTMFMEGIAVSFTGAIHMSADAITFDTYQIFGNDSIMHFETDVSTG